MINTKKEQERKKLHSTILKIAKDFHDIIDGWGLKQYIITILFYRFISENLVSYINEKQKKAGEENFSYADFNDIEAEHGRDLILEEKGFFIHPSELFENVCKSEENDVELNETLEKVFINIEKSAIYQPSERNIKGLFNEIYITINKLKETLNKNNKILINLLKIIGELNFGNYSDNSIDLFGDAYEYLMTIYTGDSRKLGGEFFTPQEVSELLARITVAGKTEVNKVYDPACGSGSLLLKFAKVLGKENVRNGFYGQEINTTTYNLCRINMFLHDINYDKFDIAHGNTLTDPKHWDDEPFEAIVSNPPYSIKWDGDANPLLINDERFTPAGVLAPKSKADLAFVMHTLSWLATNGTAAIVLFPGVMYRGGSEQKIRKYLIDNNYVDAVIQLPADLFFGTSIQTCILVLKKDKLDSNILFIDGSNEFVRIGTKNKLSDANVKKILDCYIAREDKKYFSRLVKHEEIKEKDYNISVGTYVTPEDTREVINITELNARIGKIVTRKNELRAQIDAIVADLEGKQL